MKKTDNNEILLSLCIPTNGVIEWVIPVIESIYQENVPEETFEVVITDNGNNNEFEIIMEKYCQKYSNLFYKKTNAVQFLNQIEAFKMAKGALIKFINHRMKLKQGTLSYLIEYAYKNKEEKPSIYFLNGNVDRKSEVFYEDFDSYVKNLSYWSSWSAGTAMWKEDFEKMDLDTEFNNYFPHIDLVFFVKNRNKYIINNKNLFEEVPVEDWKKGKYNLFYAFAVEYPGVILDLLRKGEISVESCLFVINENGKFVTELYVNYILRRKKCSYDLSGVNQHIKVFYNYRTIFLNLSSMVLKKVKQKFKTKNRGMAMNS